MNPIFCEHIDFFHFLLHFFSSPFSLGLMNSFGSYSFPDSLGDDLIIDVQDSKGHSYGRVVAQVAVIADNPV